MADPKPPAGYQLQAKLSPDIEDRRDWGELRKSLGKDKQNFLDYWRDFHKTYPDFHTAFRVVRDEVMNRPSSPAALPEKPVLPGFGGEIPNVSNAHKIGETKSFPNGKMGTWDGHGWVAN